VQEALAEIERCSGCQFDPDVVRAFCEREPALRAIRRRLTTV
jgi:response regulator RpfG family c-di-GMP phosphodiesterase